MESGILAMWFLDITKILLFSTLPKPWTSEIIDVSNSRIFLRNSIIHYFGFFLVPPLRVFNQMKKPET